MTVRTAGEFMQETNSRLTALERRLPRGGSGGDGQTGNIPANATGAASAWFRIATVDGLGSTNGDVAQIEWYGGQNFGQLGGYHALINLVQRGADLVVAEVYSDLNGVNVTPTGVPIFYTWHNTATPYVFELWVKLPPYNAPVFAELVNHWQGASAKLQWDSWRTTDPGGLTISFPMSIGFGSAPMRDALYGVPGTVAQQVALANRKPLWFNTDMGWEESYYAVTGAAGLTARGVRSDAAAGWYPTTVGPYVMMEPSTTFGATPGNYVGNWNGVLNRTGGEGWFSNCTSTGFQFERDGMYDFGWWTLMQTGSGQTDWHSRLNNSADTAVNWMSNVGPPPLTSIYQQVGAEYRGVYVRKTNRLRALCQSGSLTVHMVTGGTTYPSTRGQIWARYVAPPLVSD